MKNVIEILDRYYQSFINQEQDWNFFLGLVDYLDFIKENPDIFDGFLNKIKANRERELNRVISLEEKAFKEFEEVKKKILQSFKSKKISQNIKQKLKNLADFKNEYGISEKGFFEFNSKLTGIIKSLWQNGYKELVKDILNNYADGYDKENPEEDILRGFYYLSPSGFEKYILKPRDFSIKFGIELWGAYSKLSLLRNVFVFMRSGKFPETLKDTDEARNSFLEFVYEMQYIQDNDTDEYISSSDSSYSDDEKIETFKKNQYQLYASRVHNYLIQELSKKEGEKTTEKQIKEIALYLNQNGELYREPKEKYCYPMGEKSNRHKIVRFLATNKGYQLTGFISTELGVESEKSIRTEIGKIRNNIKKYLKIDGKDFLQGKKESGYRINPKYKVIPKNE